jgi:hypothetical protein
MQLLQSRALPLGYPAASYEFSVCLLLNVNSSQVALIFSMNHFKGNFAQA